MTPSVQEYKNYRYFLKDYYDHKKSLAKDFTYAKFSELAGIVAPNFLKLIIDGKRNLTVDRIHMVAEAIDLSADSREYFEALVLYNQSEESSSKLYYQNRLERLKTRFPALDFNQGARGLMEQWFYPAVILYLEGKDQDVSLHSLAKLIGVPLKEIKAIVEFLHKENILQIEDGKFQIPAPYLRIRKDESNILQQNYLEAQLKKSAQAFREKYHRGGKNLARFYTHTFSFRKDDWELFNELIRSFLENMTQESNRNQGDQIGQMNIQMFTFDQE